MQMKQIHADQPQVKDTRTRSFLQSILIPDDDDEGEDDVQFLGSEQPKHLVNQQLSSASKYGINQPTPPKNITNNPTELAHSTWRFPEQEQESNRSLKQCALTQSHLKIRATTENQAKIGVEATNSTPLARTGYLGIQGDRAYSVETSGTLRKSVSGLRSPSIEIVAATNKRKQNENNHVSPGNDGETREKKIPVVIDVDVIDLGEDEAELEKEIQLAGLDFEEVESVTPRRKSTVIPQRNPKIALPFIHIDTATTNKGVIIRRGETYEILDQLDFILVRDIIKNVQNDDVLIRGLRLQRVRDLNGLLPKKQNEAFFSVEIELEDGRSYLEQGLIEIALTEVLNKRETFYTNKLFPECSWRDDPRKTSQAQAETSGELTVRWRYICYYPTAQHRSRNLFNERCIERNRLETLVDLEKPRYSSQDAKVRYKARGETIPGGSFIPSTQMPLKPSRCGKSSLASSPQRTPSSTKSQEFSEKGHYSVVVEGSKSPSVAAVDRSLTRKRMRTPSTSGLTAAHFCEGRTKKQTFYLNNEKDFEEIYTHIESIRAQLPKETTADEQSPRPMSKTSNATNPETPRAKVSVNCIGAALIAPPGSGEIHRAQGSIISKAIRKPGQAYTYGDCFCGAGGSTRGAVSAGLKVIWGFDFGEHASRTWKLNFPDAKIHTIHAFDFIQLGTNNSKFKVDILHLSPPCQYFSPAHTVQGQHDEMNSASMLACHGLIKIIKPRIFTLEQTFGIMSPRFIHWFHTAIHMFTDLEYSIRWKIVRLQEWGLPQRRLRLVMIGACPGEVLPDFPPMTHNVDGTNGKKKFVSVNSVLRSIPPNAPDHDVQNAIRRNLPPWDGNSIAPRCITTSGGQNYHPNGMRDFTNREFAALQGFPNNHVFSGIEVKKQIGNAVPPPIAKLLFSHIKKALEKADGIEAEAQETLVIEDEDYLIGRNQPIIIDDD